MHIVLRIKASEKLPRRILILNALVGRVSRDWLEISYKTGLFTFGHEWTDQLYSDPNCLMDSGIRSGLDVVHALGAKAVMIGRPWVYALAPKQKARGNGTEWLHQD